MTSKLEIPIHGTADTRPFRHPATFLREATTGPERLVVGNASDGANLLLRLASELEPPYLLLYVLHTSRGPSEEGRYESEPHSREELANFLERYGPYIAGDARFDLWVHSPENATIVWDRHDVLYAYGPLERFESALVDLGYARGRVDVPFPHVHHYRREYDADADELLASRAWHHTDLQPSDRQFPA